MSSMFEGATAFNQPPSSWNVSKVTNMSHMFYFASNFNQDLSSWNTSSLRIKTNMFTGSKRE